jgi:hypothetical protein
VSGSIHVHLRASHGGVLVLVGGARAGRQRGIGPDVERVTYLRLEIVGPRMIFVVGDVDLTGDDTESHLADRLRALEARISESPAVAGAVLSLSAPDEPTITA